MNESRVRQYLLCCLLILAGCMGERDSAVKSIAENTVKQADTSQPESAQWVQIFESRGVIQCEYKGISAKESEAKLMEIGIDVTASECGVLTGIFTISVCGAAGNGIIIHRIAKDDLESALQLGFQEVGQLTQQNSEPGYEITSCK